MIFVFGTTVKCDIYYHVVIFYIEIRLNTASENCQIILIHIINIVYY
jgi:hypothetical protein